MQKLRWLIVLLIIFLTILMNIERLDFGRQNLIDIDSFVYVIGVGGVIAVLLVPVVGRLPLYLSFTLMLLLYFLLKVFVFNQHPIVGGFATYVTITEIAFLSILVYLSNILLDALVKFEAVVEQLLYPEKNPRVLDMEHATERVQQEFNKCRRHNRSLSILLIKPTVESAQERFNHLVEGIRLAVSERLLSRDFSSKIADLMRRSDYLIEQPKLNRFIVLCPEADEDLIPILQDRMSLILKQKLEGISVNYGYATFPGDALTFEELLKNAESKLDEKINSTLAKQNNLVSNEIS